MESLTAAEVVGRTLAALGVRDAFGVLGSGNFIATQALHAAGARVPPRAPRGRRDLHGRRLRAGQRPRRRLQRPSGTRASPTR